MFGQLWVPAADELVLVVTAEDVVTAVLGAAGAVELELTTGVTVEFVLGEAAAPAIPAVAPPTASAPATSPALIILVDIRQLLRVVPRATCRVSRWSVARVSRS